MDSVKISKKNEQSLLELGKLFGAKNSQQSLSELILFAEKLERCLQHDCKIVIKLKDGLEAEILKEHIRHPVFINGLDGWPGIKGFWELQDSKLKRRDHHDMNKGR